MQISTDSVSLQKLENLKMRFSQNCDFRHTTVCQSSNKKLVTILPRM